MLEEGKYVGKYVVQQAGLFSMHDTEDDTRALLLSTSLGVYGTTQSVTHTKNDTRALPLSTLLCVYGTTRSLTHTENDTHASPLSIYCVVRHPHQERDLRH
jgi:hypothetical protein